MTGQQGQILEVNDTVAVDVTGHDCLAHRGVEIGPARLGGGCVETHVDNAAVREGCVPDGICLTPCINTGTGGLIGDPSVRHRIPVSGL